MIVLKQKNDTRVKRWISGVGGFQRCYKQTINRKENSSNDRVICNNVP